MDKQREISWEAFKEQQELEPPVTELRFPAANFNIRHCFGKWVRRASSTCLPAGVTRQQPDRQLSAARLGCTLFPRRSSSLPDRHCPLVTGLRSSLCPQNEINLGLYGFSFLSFFLLSLFFLRSSRGGRSRSCRLHSEPLERPPPAPLGAAHNGASSSL